MIDERHRPRKPAARTVARHPIGFELLFVGQRRFRLPERPQRRLARSNETAGRRASPACGGQRSASGIRSPCAVECPACHGADLAAAIDAWYRREERRVDDAPLLASRRRTQPRAQLIERRARRHERAERVWRQIRSRAQQWSNGTALTECCFHAWTWYPDPRAGGRDRAHRIRGRTRSTRRHRRCGRSDAGDRPPWRYLETARRDPLPRAPRRRPRSGCRATARAAGGRSRPLAPQGVPARPRRPPDPDGLPRVEFPSAPRGEVRRPGDGARTTVVTARGSVASRRIHQSGIPPKSGEGSRRNRPVGASVSSNFVRTQR